MTINPTVQHALVRAGQQSLEDVISRDADFAPMITVCDGLRIQPIVIAGDWDLFMEACHMIVHDGMPFDMLVHTVDSYHMMVDKKKGKSDQMDMDIADSYAGSLRERFEAGDTRVVEALTITFVTEDDLAMVMLPYRRKGNRVIWLAGERKDVTGLDVQGRYPDVLRATVVAARSV